MEAELIAAITGASVGVAGIATGALQAYLGFRERARNSRNEYVVGALARFTGGRQERNVGISIIGHFWNQVPELEGVFVRLLTNQGLYIIGEGNPEKAHEFNNMERIVELLEGPRKWRPEYKNYYTQLIHGLESARRRAGGAGVTHKVLNWIRRLGLSARRQAKGARVTQKVLDDWIQRLDSVANAPPSDRTRRQRWLQYLRPWHTRKAGPRSPS